MKELTIEQKAKAYDEAKARISKAYNSNRCTIGFMNEIFPELNVSGDEKIRKELISYFAAVKSEEIWDDDISFGDIVAWLEKQKVLTTEEDLQGKENVLWCIKQAKKYAKDENEMGTCWFAEKWLEKQGNPTDINPSEFDLHLNKLLKQFETLPKEELASSLSFYLNVVQNDGTYREEKQGEQKPQRMISAEAKEAMYGKPAWSEEDEKAINDILWIIEAYRKNGFNETHIQMADNSEKWLKSLKQRIKL